MEVGGHCRRRTAVRTLSLVGYRSAGHDVWLQCASVFRQQVVTKLKSRSKNQSFSKTNVMVTFRSSSCLLFAPVALSPPVVALPVQALTKAPTHSCCPFTFPMRHPPLQGLAFALSAAAATAAAIPSRPPPAPPLSRPATAFLPAACRHPWWRRRRCPPPVPDGQSAGRGGDPGPAVDQGRGL